MHGAWRTRDRALELGAPAVEPFFRTLELWLTEGVSLVADHTFQRGVSESDVAERVGSRSELVYVHCRSRHALARFEQRMRTDPLCGGTRLQKLLPLARQLQTELTEPLDFNCPVIVVDTDDGFRPTVADVAGEIDSLYSRPRVHDLDRPAQPLA